MGPPEWTLRYALLFGDAVSAEYLLSKGANPNIKKESQEDKGLVVNSLRAAHPENVVFLRIDEEAGHGAGSTRAQTDELYADMIAFINWRLGRPGWTPAAPWLARS